MAYVTERGEEFSPVKNAEGVDSPLTCRRDQIRRSARWLAQAGVKIPQRNSEPDATIEISPLFAVNADELSGKKLPCSAINAGQTIYLE
jgi:UDP-N-acetylglucosamine/UDP-N-acetylgalactosamine diphosphorylase